VVAKKKLPVTPSPSPSSSGSLVLFYYGNSKFLTTFQETIRLKRAMEGYDYVVLLKHNEIPGLIDISEKDEELADVVDIPTPDNLFKYLRQMASDGRMIDVWIFAHGSPGSFSGSGGTHGTMDDISDTRIRDELAPAKTGLTQVPIRMMWSTACYAAGRNEAWRSVGAKAVAGARGVNFFPHQFGKFAEEWNKSNVSFRAALDRSDTGVSRAVGHSAMLAYARITQAQWGGCPGVKTVLGKHACAKRYFTEVWFYLRPADYVDNLSGRDNMDYASEKLAAGNDDLTKSATPSWQ
jgi:hypothetical protein